MDGIEYTSSFIPRDNEISNTRSGYYTESILLVIISTKIFLLVLFQTLLHFGVKYIQYFSSMLTVLLVLVNC
jgi:NADH:ubiquinone oxidoreductase subunit 3 (subunit A)